MVDCSASSLLFRMLWFDEVLTVNLLMKLPLHRLYFAYEIPNNHIVFTLLEKIWYSVVGMVTGFSYFYFRLVPLFCGGAAIVMLVRKMIRSCAHCSIPARPSAPSSARRPPRRSVRS